MRRCTPTWLKAIEHAGDQADGIVLAIGVPVGDVGDVLELETHGDPFLQYLFRTDAEDARQFHLVGLEAVFDIQFVQTESARRPHPVIDWQET